MLPSDFSEIMRASPLLHKSNWSYEICPHTGEWVCWRSPFKIFSVWIQLMSMAHKRTSLSDCFISSDGAFQQTNPLSDSKETQARMKDPLCRNTWCSMQGHQIYSHTTSLEDRCMTKVYNMYMCVLMYTEHRISLLRVISSLQLILLIRHKTVSIQDLSGVMWTKSTE